MTTKEERRLKIKAGVRGKISGTPERPRLTVFRSNKQIYAQVIDDTTGKTLAAASSLKLDVKAPKKEIAAKVGELIAKGAQEAGVQTVVFDRNGYLYHGRIKELADAAAIISNKDGEVLDPRDEKSNLNEVKVKITNIDSKVTAKVLS